MYKYISALKNYHKGEDIYVLGSGASMNYLDKSFFNNKITIGINYINKLFPCTYSFMKDVCTHEGFDYFLKLAREHDSIPMTTDIYGEKNEHTHFYERDDLFYIVPVEKWNAFGNMDLIGTEKFITGHLTMSTAIHIAFYLGAANIVLCGIDGGILDEQLNVNGYYDKLSENKIEHLKEAVSHPYNEIHLKRIRKRLKDFGVNLVSLNPFLNIGLEGHKYYKQPIKPENMWMGELDE